MKNQKHTPGPWMNLEVEGIFDSRTHGPSIQATNGQVICAMDTMDPDMGHEKLEEISANAHLIAAAPEMLELLNKIAELIEQDADGGQDYDSHVYASGILTEVEKVLAKARGES